MIGATTTWTSPVSLVDIDGEEVALSELKAILQWARAQMAEGERRESEKEKWFSEIKSRMKAGDIAVHETNWHMDDLYFRLGAGQDAAKDVGRHGVGPIAVAAGMDTGATLDELYKRLRHLCQVESAHERQNDAAERMQKVQSATYRAFQTAGLIPDYDWHRCPYNLSGWIKVNLRAYVDEKKRRIEELERDSGVLERALSNERELRKAANDHVSQLRSALEEQVRQRKEVADHRMRLFKAFKEIDELRVQAEKSWPEPREIDSEVMDGREVLVWLSDEWSPATFVDQGGVVGWYCNGARMHGAPSFYLPMPPDLEVE